MLMLNLDGEAQNREKAHEKIVSGDHILLTIINALQTDIDMTWETDKQPMSCERDDRRDHHRRVVL